MFFQSKLADFFVRMGAGLLVGVLFGWLLSELSFWFLPDRETITREVPKINYRYVKQSGGRGMYGHVVFNMKPVDGVTFTQLVRKGAPVIYGGFTSNVDMKSGAPAFGTPEYMKATIVGGVAGFACGVGTAFFLLSSFKGGLPFSVVKTVVGFSFLILFAGSVATLYRTVGVTFAIAIPARFKGTPFLAGAAAFFAGMLAGALMAGLPSAVRAGASLRASCLPSSRPASPFSR